jgi:hypothetical protein
VEEDGVWVEGKGRGPGAESEVLISGMNVGCGREGAASRESGGRALVAGVGEKEGENQCPTKVIWTCQRTNFVSGNTRRQRMDRGFFLFSYRVLIIGNGERGVPAKAQLSLGRQYLY